MNENEFTVTGYVKGKKTVLKYNGKNPRVFYHELDKLPEDVVGDMGFAKAVGVSQIRHAIFVCAEVFDKTPAAIYEDIEGRRKLSDIIADIEQSDHDLEEKGAVF